MAVRKKAVKKKVAKKRIAKKKVIKNVTAKKKITRKRKPLRESPDPARLRKRRAKNTQKGYYPNPVDKYYIIRLQKQNTIYYFDGMRGVEIRSRAVEFRTEKHAVEIAKKIAKDVGRGIDVFVDSQERKKKETK